MDDPINVHGNALRIVEKLAPNHVLVRYMHHESFGLTFVEEGDPVGFILESSLRTVGTGRVAAVRKSSPQDTEIIFTEPMPDEIGVGDTLENLVWLPDVTIRKNFFGNCRARGVLVTSPGMVRIEDNVFESSGSGVLISGDALWENGFGFVMPPDIDPAALPAARATLDAIASLHVRVLIPGHGAPFTDVGAALERAYTRLEMFEREPERLPRYALKVILAFVLLDQRRLSLAGMPAYVQRVGIYREFNARFLRLAPEVLASSLVRDLEKAGAVRCEDGFVMPR
jgi:hypothetical protein